MGTQNENIYSHFFTYMFPVKQRAAARTVTDKWTDSKDGIPDADALMNPTKGLKDEEAGVLNEILQARHQKEVINENLNENTATMLL